VTAVKGFAGVYYKSEEGVAKGVVCREDKEDKQRCKELVASLVKVKLKQL
jgi:hypothetical protein